MAKILNDQQIHQLRRDVTALLLSPQGRALGRVFLTEIGKGEAGDLRKIKEEVFDVMSQEINALYASTAPTMSKG